MVAKTQGLGGHDMNRMEPIARGRYYQMATTPTWDFIAANGLNFFEGAILECLVSWRYRNGIDGLHQARNYLDKLIELETADVHPHSSA